MLPVEDGATTDYAALNFLALTWLMARIPVENDQDVRAALEWLGRATGDPSAFFDRLEGAQQGYREFTACEENFGKDTHYSDFTNDIVAGFFAQTKSLLDDRRSYDQALASTSAPWLKQLGRNAAFLDGIEGARERAARMLREVTVAPDNALFELVMASNYAAEGSGVAFVDEAKGHARTPDLRLVMPEIDEPFFTECKRIGRGQYELAERARHSVLFSDVAELIYTSGLSVHIDVTYTRELKNVPVTYLTANLRQAVSSSVQMLDGYPWRDEFGHGTIRPANLTAAAADIRTNSSLYFGTKLARLLSGQVVREAGYHLAASARGDRRDPRYIDRIRYGSVVTWQCVAAEAIERKSRYVKSKLAEADRQLQGWGPAIAHLALDAELASESSDLRQARNIEAIRNFRSRSDLLMIYVHYLVTRISEHHSWLIDETVDTFAPTTEPVEPTRIFPAAEILANDLPAWRQQITPR